MLDPNQNPFLDPSLDPGQDNQMLFVVKAASKFQKALGQKDAHVIHKLYNDMRKQRKVKKHKSAKLVDVQN